MNKLEIDYSAVPVPAHVPKDDDWEPPQHKFFGRKLENGKTEKEPIYVHQEYPRLVYSLQGEKIVARMIYSDTELEKLGDGWEKNPSAFGYISAPSWEQMQAAREKAVPDDKSALVAEAKALGIPNAGANWGIEKLKSAIAEAKAN